ncbi:MAG: hypothetical protein AABX86_03195 [Nanoarchaeota archaeon]
MIRNEPLGKESILNKGQIHALMGHNIGDWVLLRDPQNNVSAGRIQGVNTEGGFGFLTIERHFSYMLTEQGYRRKPHVVLESVALVNIIGYSSVSEETVKNFDALNPYVEYLERDVRVTYGTQDYMGRIARVFPGTVILNPYVDTWSFPETPEIVDEYFFLPGRELKVPHPLRKSLHEIVQEYKTKLQEAKRVQQKKRTLRKRTIRSI